MSDRIPALVFRWNAADKVMRLLGNGDRFEDGQTYLLEAREERSRKEHKRFFAWVAEAWESLPAGPEQYLKSAEHLRKWALCKSGYCDTDLIVCDSDADAMRLAAYARRKDDFAVTELRGNVVQIFTAKSQSEKAMGKVVFRQSVESVERVIWDLLQIRGKR